MHDSPLSEFSRNIVFFCAFFSWCLAQFVKLVIAWRKTGRVDFRYFHSTGGMPSAHSATVSGLATAVGLSEGFDSSIFAFAATFAIITMFDASTLRYSVGRHASILNKISMERQIPGVNSGKLKESLGHTLSEVYAGMFLGIAFSASLFYLWKRGIA